MTNRPWKLSLVRSSSNVCIGFVMRLVLRLKNRLLSTFTSATLNASTSKTASLPTKSRARPRNLTLFYDGLFFLSSTLPGTVKRCKVTFNAYSSLFLGLLPIHLIFIHANAVFPDFLRDVFLHCFFLCIEIPVPFAAFDPVFYIGHGFRSVLTVRIDDRYQKAAFLGAVIGNMGDRDQPSVFAVNTVWNRPVVAAGQPEAILRKIIEQSSLVERVQITFVLDEDVGDIPIPGS